MGLTGWFHELVPDSLLQVIAPRDRFGHPTT